MLCKKIQFYKIFYLKPNPKFQSPQSHSAGNAKEFYSDKNQ